MRTLMIAMLVLASAAPVQAGSVQVSGKLGYLSEWEISGQVSDSPATGKGEFSGPITIKHVGVCTPGRPVEMSGELRYHISGWVKPRMRATLVVDGVECGFDAVLSQSYEGALACTQWRGVPLSLSVKSTE